MIPGPIAGFLLALVFVWTSPEASGFGAVLKLTGVGLLAWLLLHPLLGAILRRIVRARFGDDPRVAITDDPVSGRVGPLFPEQFERTLWGDPVYRLAHIGLWAVKWSTICAVFWMVV